MELAAANRSCATLPLLRKRTNGGDELDRDGLQMRGHPVAKDKEREGALALAAVDGRFAASSLSRTMTGKKGA